MLNSPPFAVEYGFRKMTEVVKRIDEGKCLRVRIPEKLPESYRVHPQRCNLADRDCLPFYELPEYVSLYFRRLFHIIKYGFV